MLKSVLLIGSLFFAIALQCVAQEIPFTLEKGFVIVAAKIKKEIPVKAAIFTGSQDSFGPDIVIKYKITPGYGFDGPHAQGLIEDKTVIFADVPQIVLGDEKPVSSLRFRQGSVEAMSKGSTIDLILGADFFRGKIVQFDFKKKVIRFLEKPPVDYKQTVASQPSANVKTLVFKMEQSVENNFGVSMFLPVVRDVTFDGTKIRTLFDTSTAAPISLSPAAIKEYKLGDVPDKSSTRSGQIKSLGLGEGMSDVPALLFGKDAGFDRSIKDYGAIIGLGVMQNFLVTFDWKEHMLVLQR